MDSSTNFETWFNAPWSAQEGIDMLECAVRIHGGIHANSTALHLVRWAENNMTGAPESEFDSFIAYLSTDDGFAYALQEGWPAALRAALVAYPQA